MVASFFFTCEVHHAFCASTLVDRYYIGTRQIKSFLNRLYDYEELHQRAQFIMIGCNSPRYISGGLKPLRLKLERFINLLATFININDSTVWLCKLPL